MNEGAVITDRETYAAYDWPDPGEATWLRDGDLLDSLPSGMKLIPLGPPGVLETLMSLVGFQNLCMMLVDDPDLLAELCEAIGSRLVQTYRILAGYEALGAVVVTDDWGFKTQTMFSPPDMRQYIVPWHVRIVAAIHAAGKPAILHSCGYPVEMIDDVIDTIGYDARHSFEDAILPVEDAYDRWGDRIAILGGIDVDFLCRATPAKVRARARALLDRTRDKGGYALGSGNSIAEYVPMENYFAMTAAALTA